MLFRLLHVLMIPLGLVAFIVCDVGCVGPDEPRFIDRDAVRIVRGFHRGKTGTVVAWDGSAYRVTIDDGPRGYFSIGDCYEFDEGDLEPFTKPSVESSAAGERVTDQAVECDRPVPFRVDTPPDPFDDLFD